MLKTKFSRELGLILVVKIFMLYGLWAMCFKDTKQKIVGSQLEERLLS